MNQAYTAYQNAFNGLDQSIEDIEKHQTSWDELNEKINNLRTEVDLTSIFKDLDTLGSGILGSIGKLEGNGVDATAAKAGINDTLKMIKEGDYQNKSWPDLKKDLQNLMTTMHPYIQQVRDANAKAKENIGFRTGDMFDDKIKEMQFWEPKEYQRKYAGQSPYAVAKSAQDYYKQDNVDFTAEDKDLRY
jgi:prefoldin subunit 5